MPTIKFTHRYRGWKDANPHGGEAQQPGDIVTCDQKQADWFIEKDWAVLVAEKKEKKVETAAIKPEGEKAVVPTGKPRGRPKKVDQQPSRAFIGADPKEEGDVNI